MCTVASASFRNRFSIRLVTGAPTNETTPKPHVTVYYLIYAERCERRGHRATSRAKVPVIRTRSSAWRVTIVASVPELAGFLFGRPLLPQRLGGGCERWRLKRSRTACSEGKTLKRGTFGRRTLQSPGRIREGSPELISYMR